MKKLVMCLMAGFALCAGIAYAGGEVCTGVERSCNAAPVVSAVPAVSATRCDALTTVYGAGGTCLAAVGGTVRAPLQVAKDAINSLCMGLSDGDTFFWD